LKQNDKIHNQIPFSAEMVPAWEQIDHHAFCGRHRSMCRARLMMMMIRRVGWDF
jgi:hypothetical protein